MILSWNATAPVVKRPSGTEYSIAADRMAGALDEGQSLCMIRAENAVKQVLDVIYSGKASKEELNLELPGEPDQYTLRYFERAGNLMATVPPHSVVKMSTIPPPADPGCQLIPHTLVARYPKMPLRCVWITLPVILPVVKLMQTHPPTDWENNGFLVNK